MEAKGKQKGAKSKCFLEPLLKPCGMRGARVLMNISAYKQAYTAFLLPSAKGLTRPASLQAGGAPNLIAPRIPPGQEHLR